MAALFAIFAVFLEIYSFVILARVLMSWVNINPDSPIARTLYDLTEPVLAPVRNVLPTAGGLDFSPIIVLILVQMVANMLRMMAGG